jgi:hypothetical protein
MVPRDGPEQKQKDGDGRVEKRSRGTIPFLVGIFILGLNACSYMDRLLLALFSKKTEAYVA